MELDDLRHQWQQPEPAASPALTNSQLDALLKGRTGGLVEKMRRNAWLEAGFTVLTGLVMLGALPYNHDALFRAYTGPMLVLVVILAVFYYRLLGVLRRMAEPTGSVRGHLGTLAQGLRQLLRFYYRLSLAIVPVMMLSISGFVIWQLTGSGKVRHWLPIAVAAGIFLVTGIVGQVAIVYLTRWWMQRLYGQHLDRLEGQLRELDEPAA